jgi:peptide/nickel transport system permease protein
MLRYIAQRLLMIFPVWIAVAIVVFALLRFVPGDPATVLLGAEATPEQLEDLRVQLGLDRPVHLQFLEWTTHILQGDLGTSLFSKRPVSTEIVERLPRSLELAALSTLISLSIALPSGIISAIKRDTIWDQGFLAVALFAICVPSFWLALLLILAFSVNLDWFPVRGYRPLSEGFPTWLKHMWLPALSYGLIQAAELARMTRASLIEIVELDYIRTARAKGLSERAVILRHALKNAMIPIVTVMGINLGVLLTATVVIEYVFGLPGIGSLVVDSIRNRDYPVVQGVILTIATMYILLNLAVDVSYAFFDPRIRYRS